MNEPSAQTAKQRAMSKAFIIQGVIGAVLIVGAVLCFVYGQVLLGILLIGLEIVVSLVAIFWAQHIQRRVRNGE